MEVKTKIEICPSCGNEEYGKRESNINYVGITKAGKNAEGKYWFDSEDAKVMIVVECKKCGFMSLQKI